MDVGFFFIHPSQRALFFLAPFALLLHKYAHMFTREMGNPLSCVLPAVCLCFLSRFSVLCLFCWTPLPTCTLWRSHQGIWERCAPDREKLKGAGLTWVSGGLPSSLGVLPTSKFNPFLLSVAKGDSRVRPAIERQWKDVAIRFQSFR